MLIKPLIRTVRPALAGVFVVAAVVAAVSCQHEAAETPKYASTAAPATTDPAPAAPAAAAVHYPFTFPPAPSDLSDADRVAGSRSCLACHSGLTHQSTSGAVDNVSMHDNNLAISCVGCHGGTASFDVPESVVDAGPHTREYERLKNKAHVQPTHRELWVKPGTDELSSANPVATGARTIVESADFIRFVNPGDVRSASEACGACHKEQVDEVRTSMMRHGALLWEAALYNNGSLNQKSGVFGEFYSPDGTPAVMPNKVYKAGASFSVTGQSQGKFDAEIKLSNYQAVISNGWKLEFDLSSDISDVQNARVISHVKDHYVLGNVDANGSIPAGLAAVIGFSASGRPAPPDNYLLNGEPISGQALGFDVHLLRPPPPTRLQAERAGVLSLLWPIQRWEISQPGNILRVFERGGAIRPVVGEPSPKDEPGRPDVKLSIRGYGTDLRTDPVSIGLQKTRLLDPTLNFTGSNDHPGDYRAGGCSACHVIYANDRSPVHSTAMFAGYGNLGQSFSHDSTVNPTAPGRAPASQPSTQPWAPLDTRRERGHPIQHAMVKEMPTSTCIVCHVHPGTNVLNSYLGFMWWDNETDGKLMYPAHQKNPDTDTAHQSPSNPDSLTVPDYGNVHLNVQQQAAMHNPEASAARGLWSDLYPKDKDQTGHVAGANFLEKLGGPKFNQRLTRTQFADFHGHGWVFRAVFKQDRHGNLLDYAGNVVPPSEAGPEAFNEKMAKGVAFQSPKVGDHPPANVPVHLKDVHLERGMQCVDCHFEQDAHGDGHLYNETRNAVQIQCEDCHGTAEHKANIFTYLSDTSNQKALAEAFSGTAAKVKTELANPDERKDAEKAVADYNKKVIASHFEISNDGERLQQKQATNSAATDWDIPQVLDTTDPGSWWSKAATSAEKVRVGVVDATTRPAAMENDPATRDRATLARYAHTIRTDNKTWGFAPSEADVKSGKQLPLAHPATRMSCYACHSSWNTSCFGCHIPQRANQRMPMQHNEAILTRNYTNYNYQTLRDDVYMLGVDSTGRDHKIVPIRSSCAVMVSSQDALRQWIYSQQQTISAEGYAGTAFTPYFPHTVRSVETKQCTDCHLAKANDNNAIMAQLLLQGTNSVNFIGRFSWVGEGSGGLEAVGVTELDEPQAVIGSSLHQLAYPDNYRKHLDRKRELTEAYGHTGTVLDLQLRGEYLYAACGSDGFIAYDVANIEDKGFSERIITAPVSPLGQRFYVRSKYATCICSPSTLALDPTRKRLPENEEGLITEIGDLKPLKKVGIHLLYAFLYMTDRDEGLIVIGNSVNTPHDKGGPGVSTLLDGDPDNNFLQRAPLKGGAPSFNPGGILDGARHMALYGTLAYMSCNRGIVVVDLDNPLDPKVVATLGRAEGINAPRRVAFQFRYAFVCDADGVKVLDITDPRRPSLVRDKNGTVVDVPILDARDIYLSRTYGYVAAGREGLVILDLEKPDEPRRLYYPNDFPRDFNAEAGIDDATAVRVGMTNASMFAYVADGKNGLKVLQLTSPEWTPTYLGFSPKPEPRLIAWYKTNGPAIALSKGLDRDRAVDESGNQLSVFNRKGARPFTLEEMQRLYLGADHKPWTVSDVPEGAALKAPAEAAPAETPPPTPPPTRTRLPFGRH